MKNLFYFFLFLTLYSCNKEKVDSKPYFAFDEVGEKLLSELKLNDTLKFVGTNNNIQNYRIFKIDKTKEIVEEVLNLLISERAIVIIISLLIMLKIQCVKVKKISVILAVRLSLEI